MGRKGCGIITGASRGIGAAIAAELARGGLPVVINYSRDEKSALTIREQIIKNGGNAVVCQCDVADRNSVDEMTALAVREFGAVHTLVNNAGISDIKLFTDITPDEWRKMESVNLDGVFNCCQSVLPHMIHEKFGRIINISSVWGVYGASCEVHYSALKAGVIGLTKALAKEVAPSGITVNAIAPGCIMTDMLKAECDEETLRQLAQDTPVGRIGTPSDVAKAAAFFSSEDQSFITGQVLGVDGGFR